MFARNTHEQMRFSAVSLGCAHSGVGFYFGQAFQCKQVTSLLHGCLRLIA